MSLIHLEATEPGVPTVGRGTLGQLDLSSVIAMVAPHASPADAGGRHLGELAENVTLRAVRDYFRFARHTARTCSKRGFERYSSDSLN
jgi:hypothetical protein